MKFFLKKKRSGDLYIVHYFNKFINANFDNQNIKEWKIYKEFNKKLRGKNIERIFAKEGDALRIDENNLMLFYNPDVDRSINDNSLVIKMFSEEGGSAIFTGDVSSRRFTELLEGYENLRKSDILKFPHHGIGYTNSIFKRISCDYIVITNNLTGLAKKFIEDIKSRINVYVTGETDYYQFWETPEGFIMVER